MGINGRDGRSYFVVAKIGVTQTFSLTVAECLAARLSLSITHDLGLKMLVTYWRPSPFSRIMRRTLSFIYEMIKDYLTLIRFLRGWFVSMSFVLVMILPICWQNMALKLVFSLLGLILHCVGCRIPL